MNKRQERALEIFLYITFTIALFAGAGAGAGNSKSNYDVFPEDFKSSTKQSDAVLGQWQAEDIQLQSRISFVGNGDKINALGRRELLKHAAILKSNPHVILNIIAPVGKRGSAISDSSLREERAKQVYELLVFYGTSEEQLIVDVSDEFSQGGGANLNGSCCVELQYLSALSSSPQR